MLFLFLLPLAGSSNDLLALIDAADYFKSRQIESQPDKLVELAAKKPDGSADRVAQLLAIRWLGENAAETKKTAKGRDTLQQLAEGKLGQDPLGFTKDYARQALARLDGKPLPRAVIGDDTLKTEVLAWIPDGVTFFYALDMRTKSKEALFPDDSLAIMLRNMMPPRGKQEVYNLADTIGNVRLDQLALAMTTGPNGEPETIYLRCNGLGDRELLAKYLLVQQREATKTEEKGPNGESITLLQSRREPAMAFIGNTDFIVAGRERNQNDNLSFVRDVLEVRAGKKPNAVKGSLAAILKEAPAGASVLTGGALPGEFARLLVQPRGQLPALPKDALISVVVDKNIDLRLDGKLASADEAKAMAEAIATWKQAGQAALKLPGLPWDGDVSAVFQKSLDSVKTETNGDKVQVSAAASVAAVRTMLQTLIKLGQPVQPDDN
jgi:hypothetical protein